MSRRAVGWLQIVLVYVLLFVVAAFATTYLVTPNPGSAGLPARLLLALGFLAGPVWAFVRTIFHQSLRWWPCAALLASLALFTGWMVHDDTVIRHDPDHPALRSDFPDAATTHALVLRYAKNVPDSLHDTVPPSSLPFPAFTAAPGFAAEWIAFVRTHRKAIGTRWGELAAPRAWFDEMSAQPKLADLLRDFDDPIPGFVPLRELSRHASAHATLLALEGRADEAIAILLPILDVGQKLETHARTLVRRMIAVVIQRQTILTLRVILDQSAVSPESRAGLAALLGAPKDAAEGARLLLLCEYHVLSRHLHTADLVATLDAFSLHLPKPLRPLCDLFYNPIATINLDGDIIHRLAELAARRDLPGMHAVATAAVEPQNVAHWSRKNLAGHLLVAMAIPAFDKVVLNYWELQDWRGDLLARLQKE